MTDMQLLEAAKAEGFFASIITPEQVPVDSKFRSYCEENLCGNYDVSYACPPKCGTPEELHQKILAEEKILIIQTISDIENYQDMTSILKAKSKHSAMLLRLRSFMEKNGFTGFCAGYSDCSICETCKQKENQPCTYPDQKFIRISAFCIDVAELARRCELEFSWSPDKLYLFGMIAFHKKESN